MKRAVITGPTGSIGVALVECLAANGVEVVAVVRPNSKRSDRIKENELVHKVECGLDNLSQLSELIPQGADVFYHFGWDGTFGNSRNNMHGQNMNVKYALDAVEAAADLGCKVFIGAGSQAEYGRFEGKLNSEVPTFPENGYGIAKLCAGQMTRILCEQKGISHIWTRILSIYGPFDGDNTMVMSTIYKLLAGEVPACTKGEQMWDYLYSKDAANAMYLIGRTAMQYNTVQNDTVQKDNGQNGNMQNENMHYNNVKNLHGKIYCIGSGNVRPLKEYIEMIKDTAAPDIEVEYGKVPYNDKQVMYLCADIDDLKKDTGFEPKYTFEQGIKETVEWCRQRTQQ